MLECIYFFIIGAFVLIGRKNKEQLAEKKI